MHYYDPDYEPEFNKLDSYCLTWYGDGYSSDGPYGEPLQYTQEEGLSNGSNLVYDTMELPSNGGSDWVDEFRTYFASCWDEDIVPCGYGDGEHQGYNGSLEKAEGTNAGGNREGTYSRFGDGIEGAHSVDPWPVYHFEFADGVEDDYSIHGKPNQAPAAGNNEDPWDYVRLCESIFGYWPCLQRLDEERPPGLLLTYSH